MLDSTSSELANQARWLLVFVLRFLGVLDLTAITVPFLPDEWIAAAHAGLGLGTIPTDPIVGYLARSASIMYALHGLVVLFISFDLPRYWWLIRLLAATAIVHGGLMVLTDLRVGMPAWWMWLEGPCFAATGAAMLLLQACQTPPELKSR